MNKNAFTPQDLINDLKRISFFKDNRVLIWYCNLYIEHFVKLIYKKYKGSLNFGSCSECKKSLEPYFLDKVDELSKANLIDKENTHDQLIKMVYSSRNTAGHELDFEEIKIIEKIIKTLSQTKMHDPHGLLLKTFSNISPWKRFEIAAVAVVTKLFQNYEEINNRTFNNKLIFKINEGCTEIWPEIMSKDDPNYLSNEY